MVLNHFGLNRMLVFMLHSGYTSFKVSEVPLLTDSCRASIYVYDMFVELANYKTGSKIKMSHSTAVEEHLMLINIQLRQALHWEQLPYS